MKRALLLPIALFAAISVGCFIESAKPSTFRYNCEQSEDCTGINVCSEGLCQQPCGGEDDEECPGDAPICFNGHCSSVCPADEEVCPEPQTCMLFADPSSDEEPSSGICAVACDDDAHPCPEGQLCLLGACLSTCLGDEDCTGGATCVEGFCASEF